MIQDSFGRVHNYLRISLTDNCNLRCFYCMPDEEYDFAPTSRLMQTSEVERLSRIFVEEGITKIRLTGGEPLVRKDAAKIIESLSHLPVELVMTTNATRIHEFIGVLKASNIQTINISLDTLQPDKFLLVTRRDLFHLVRSNIELLLHHGFHVKINVVVMKGFNENEINDFICWTTHIPVGSDTFHRILCHSKETGGRVTKRVFSMQDMFSEIGKQFEFLPVENSQHDTAKHFMVPGHAGSFAIISTMSAPFCSSCNRMRLTADGKLKNCLFSINETDLLTPLRNQQDVSKLIHESIRSKAKELGGQFSGTFEKLDAISIHNRPTDYHREGKSFYEISFILLCFGLFLLQNSEAQKSRAESFVVSGEVVKQETIDITKLSGYTTVHLDSLRIYSHDMQPKGLMKNIDGVLLKEILSAIPFNNENPKVLSEYYIECQATDGYHVIFSWNEIFNSETGNHAE